ncbi:MAG: hypothetical protein HQM08_05360 [Candidatus Riflebacteria bacterium]|nr:hypothetical protein [Candidatus Riflebacteria bacterium]
MKSYQKNLSLRLLLVFLFLIFTNLLGASQGNFELTSDGVFYVVRDTSGNIVNSARPDFDMKTGSYYVKDQNNTIIARQGLMPEAPASQIKIVAPVQGDSHSVKTQDALGYNVPVLKELPSNDPRYQQLKSYIESSPGVQQALAMHDQARNMKINSLQTELANGSKDPQLAQWLVNDLKKPVYLEVGDSGNIYHDPKGFVLVQQGPNGQAIYRDDAFANRLVIPPNSEAFNGGMNDSAAASVIAHETGHMIMDQMYETPNYPKTGYSGPHSKDSVTDQGFALSEGWAEAMETLANKDNLNNPTSWRLKTQKNVIQDKYIFKNQGAVDGVNDGVLKTGTEQLSTEGVNATLFYNLLQENNIQAPYSKVLQVFEQSKPQTYCDFVKSYIQQFPEDRSTVVKQFLETTKYATVDPQAGTKYKALFDAEAAYKNAPNDPRAQADYQSKLNDYNQWKDSLYKKAVVDGNIDSAVGPNSESGSASAPGFSDQTDKQFQQVRLSETLLKGKKALSQGFQQARESIKQSFSWQNVAITAGTSVAINLASQLMNGQKLSFTEAAKSVASWQFVGNLTGSALGAAAGSVMAPLIQTFVPIPVVGALAGTLLPNLLSLAGGQVGSGIGSGQSLSEALKSLDPVALAGQSAGSIVGAMLGSMIPIPIVGQVLGGIIGGILGEKLFKGIESLFRGSSQPLANKVTVPQPLGNPALSAYYPAPTVQAAQSADSYTGSVPTPASDASKYRIDPSIDRIPYDQMAPNLRSLKDDYEKTYMAYVSTLNSGDQTSAQKMLNNFITIRDRYRRALGAYVK